MRYPDLAFAFVQSNGAPHRSLLTDLPEECLAAWGPEGLSFFESDPRLWYTALRRASGTSPHGGSCVGCCCGVTE